MGWRHGLPNTTQRVSFLMEQADIISSSCDQISRNYQYIIPAFMLWAKKAGLCVQRPVSTLRTACTFLQKAVHKLFKLGNCEVPTGLLAELPVFQSWHATVEHCFNWISSCSHQNPEPSSKELHMVADLLYQTSQGIQRHLCTEVVDLRQVSVNSEPNPTLFSILTDAQALLSQAELDIDLILRWRLLHHVRDLSIDLKAEFGVCPSKSDAEPPNPALPQGVKRLMERFPECSSDEVVDALQDAYGHVGRAARILKHRCYRDAMWEPELLLPGLLRVSRTVLRLFSESASLNPSLLSKAEDISGKFAPNRLTVHAIITLETLLLELDDEQNHQVIDRFLVLLKLLRDNMGSEHDSVALDWHSVFDYSDKHVFSQRLSHRVGIMFKSQLHTPNEAAIRKWRELTVFDSCRAIASTSRNSLRLLCNTTIPLLEQVTELTTWCEAAEDTAKELLGLSELSQRMAHGARDLINELNHASTPHPFEIAQRTYELATGILEVSTESAAKAHVFKTKENSKREIFKIEQVTKRQKFNAVGRQLQDLGNQLHAIAAGTGGAVWSTTEALIGSTQILIKTLDGCDMGILRFVATIEKKRSPRNENIVRELRVARNRLKFLANQNRELVKQFASVMMNMTLVSSRKLQLYYTSGMQASARESTGGSCVNSSSKANTDGLGLLNALGRVVSTEPMDSGVRVVEQL